jgi:cytochrome b561
LYWVATDVQPASDAGSPFQRASARAAHWLLYLLMIAMPLSGWLGSRTDKLYGPIKVIVFRNTSLYDALVARGLKIDWAAFEASLDWFHKHLGGVYILLPLILIHAGAALYQHYVLHDRTLKRKLF